MTIIKALRDAIKIPMLEFVISQTKQIQYMDNPIWQPSTKRKQQAAISGFMKQLNNHYQSSLHNYDDLYRWSIKNPNDFWQAIWNYCNIKASKHTTTVLQNANKMPGASWFPESRLNFAENLLPRRDDKTALIFRGENGNRQAITYQGLFKQVEKLAAALKASGVTIGDRVTAYMPNCIETIIAMLATTSIGAVWSSCSPDFGVSGVVDRFGQIEAKILFTCDAQFYNGKTRNCLEKLIQIQQQIPSLTKTIVVPFISDKVTISHLNNTILWQDYLNTAPQQALQFEPLPFDHPLYILFSSGTTGVPKCIVHGAGGTLLQHRKEHVLHVNLTSDDIFFYYTTCGWMMWNWLVSGLASGCTLVLYDGAPMKPNDNVLWDIAEQEKISIFGTSAKYIEAMEKAELNPIKTHNIDNLQTILSTGSPLMPENYDYVYQHIKSNILLGSISGGTDIISCFALSCPILPVYRGELQCRGLGMAVEVYDDNGHSVIQQKGELVCKAPFPSMPIYFWNDSDGKKYHAAYFERFNNIWAHGDFAEITKHGGVIIYGRSDAVLNPGGVRIGTAEIYRQVEKLPEIIDAVVIGQEWQDDVRVVLFVKLREQETLTDELKNIIRTTIRDNASPRHVPAKIIQVPDIPRTISGKIVELAVRDVVHGRPVKNKEALANPEALQYFPNLLELQE